MWIVNEYCRYDGEVISTLTFSVKKKMRRLVLEQSQNKIC